MNRMATALALFAGIALTACGHYEPVINPSEVELAVGETQTLVVTAHCTGGYRGCGSPNFTWLFFSASPAIATADVVVESLSPTPFDVTGIAPGRTTLLGPGRDDFAMIRVYCASEPPVQAATPFVHAHIGESVDLVAVSPIAHRMVFAWYEGHSGDTSRPLNAGGDTLRFTPSGRGTRYIWVHASTPCSTSSAEFRIDSDVPRHRAVRR